MEFSHQIPAIPEGRAHSKVICDEAPGVSVLEGAAELKYLACLANLTIAKQIASNRPLLIIIWRT